MAGSVSRGAKRSWLRSRAGRRFLEDLAYAGPQLFLYVLVQLLPFMIALPIIFTDRLDFLDQDVAWIGLDNVRAMLQPPLVDRFGDALQRTALFALVNYVMVYLFGFVLALAMFELTSRLKGLFFTIIYMPWMISGVGIGLLMIMLFSSDTGSLNLLLEDLGLGRNTIDVKSEAGTLITLPIMYGWKTAGFNMAVFLGGLLAIPTETIESARMDGARYLDRVIHIYIPQIIPSIIIVTIFSLINSFGIFDELVGLGGLSGNANAEFLSVFVYQLGFGAGATGGAKIGTLAQAVTVSLLVFLPLVLVAFGLNRLQKRLQYH